MNQWATIKSEQNIEAAQAALAAAQQAGKVIINDVIADNFLQQILLYPEKFFSDRNLQSQWRLSFRRISRSSRRNWDRSGANINYVKWCRNL